MNPFHKGLRYAGLRQLRPDRYAAVVQIRCGPAKTDQPFDLITAARCMAEAQLDLLRVDIIQRDFGYFGTWRDWDRRVGRVELRIAKSILRALKAFALAGSVPISAARKTRLFV